MNFPRYEKVCRAPHANRNRLFWSFIPEFTNKFCGGVLSDEPLGRVFESNADKCSVGGMARVELEFNRVTGHQ
jgi:hypothetical protein